MKNFLASIAAAAAMLLVSFSPSHAQATRTWVSQQSATVGDDANPCSRSAPCRTWAGAISKTAAGGEIDAMDPGGYGAVTITKSMTIANEGVGEAGILTAGTNGITVNCNTDPNCVVNLRGLQIDGGPPGSNSLAGVKFIAGGKLTIQNSTIRNFNGGSPNGYGVMFVPGGNSTLMITDTTIINNGQAGTNFGGGVYIVPTSPGTAKADLTRVSIGGNTVGVTVQGAAKALVQHSSVFGNNKGIQANGVGTVFLSNSSVTGNTTGLAGGGAIISYGNNVINGNNTDGAPSSTVAPQ